MFFPAIKNLARWVALIAGLSLVVGAAGGVFLYALDVVTKLYQSTPWLLWILPFIGLLTLWLYQGLFKYSASGVKQLVAEIRLPSQALPLSMGPAIVSTTLLSHLGGASVGREGTALQMGGAMADVFSRFIKLTINERRILLLCGVSGGFAAVFGTPFAAAIFALEFVRMRSWAIVPCLACGLLSDWVGQNLFWAHHADYRLFLPASYTWSGVGAAMILGLVCGFVARCYVSLIRQEALRPNPEPYARIFFAGAAFSAAIYFGHLQDFTGLGLHVIEAALLEPMSITVFILKLLLTLICVSSGYRGGEVTPLFFIGVALGNFVSSFLSLPMQLSAALGFVGVFAGAGAVPLTCIAMACELFGYSIGGYAIIVCMLSHVVVGKKSLYNED